MSEQIDISTRELLTRLEHVEAQLLKKKKKEESKQKAQKEKQATPESLSQFETAREPRKSLSTFMRNQNKLYTNATNMIDRKAAIMIRINSTIVSAFVIFFTYVESIPFGSVIGMVMIVASFISLMLAINASRPNLFSILRTYNKDILSKYDRTEQGMFVIGANKDISLEKYQEAFEEVVKSQSLQIGNQVRAMYLLEKQQMRAFTLIELSYLAFMIGFSVSILVFL